MTDTIRMKDTFKSKAHNFIIDSYHRFMFSNIYTRIESFELGVAIIGRHFIMEIGVLDLVKEFKISKAGISCIINGYLEYICDTVVNEYYTLDELDFISTLISTKCNSSRAVKQCLQIIALYKDKLHLKTYAFGKVTDYPILNIDDPIEKLHELNLISKRTITCLHSEFEWSWDNSEHSRVITLADIVYVPKMFFYNVSYMGNKCVAEIVSFIDTYPIQGRIIPTKEDIKRVLDNASVGINIVDDNADIINMYFLSDMSIDDMCKRLHIELNRIHMCIERLFMRMCKVAYKNDWGLLDLITISSMLDLHAVKLGTYKHRDYYTPYIAGRIRDLLSGNE